MGGGDAAAGTGRGYRGSGGVCRLAERANLDVGAGVLRVEYRFVWRESVAPDADPKFVGSEQFHGRRTVRDSVCGGSASDGSGGFALRSLGRAAVAYGGCPRLPGAGPLLGGPFGLRLSRGSPASCGGCWGWFLLQ